MVMDIQTLREKKLIVFECISGSRSYGLSLPGSDTDIKGVYVLPKEDYYGLQYVEQISNESNDVVFYELKRFCELLARNNPNILELLAVPEECVLYKHPLMEQLRPELFLSKLCQQTFANYAVSQIKKAKGLNKKIHKPFDKERKTILDFCYVTQGAGSIAVTEWLAQRGVRQEQCGLAAINHMRDMYALFTDTEGGLNYQGIMSKNFSNDVSLSSVPKGQPLVGYLFFNKDAYSIYCREYKAYWEWVEKRNDERYQNTLQHGKNYDAKNMMHVFRLLDMAEEIASGKGIITKRPNREYLLQVRSGAFEYEELLVRAEEKMQRIDDLFQQSLLPEAPDLRKVNDCLLQLRSAFYVNQ
jgi:predicted nucleotidyltransferase